jgi:SAM-dependent methyltransferase
VRTETIAEHAAAHGGAYDLVCAFHVIEHIVEPLAFCRDLLLCVRPGGRLVLAVPSWPSAMTAIPNFALNAPPHHQSWWTIGALRALAERFGLLVEAAEVLPPSDNLKLAYWMARVAPKLTGERFFRHAWSWHLALAWSWIAGWVCDWLFGMPTRAQSLELLLIARKPE